MLTAGPGTSLQDGVAAWEGFLCSVLSCPDVCLQCSVSFVHGLKKTHHTRMYFLNRTLNSGCNADRQSYALRLGQTWLEHVQTFRLSECQQNISLCFMKRFRLTDIAAICGGWHNRFKMVLNELTFADNLKFENMSLIVIKYISLQAYIHISQQSFLFY
jgi:hypothetical protein